MNPSARNKPATMSAVAKAAGVSVSTVSRVLNGGTGISQDTIDHVLQQARELGYSSNARSRSSSRKRAFRLGVLHPYEPHYKPDVALQTRLHQQFLLGFWQAARSHDCTLSIDYIDLDEPDATSPLLAPRQVDAVIVKGSIKAEWVANLPTEGPALVFFKPPMGLTLPGSSVNCNYSTGIAKAVVHLHELGHTRIAFFCVGEELYSNIDKVSGYQRALAYLGLDDTRYLATPRLDQFNHDDRLACEQVLDQWLSMPQPPTAIIVSEAFCYTFAELLEQRHIDVPEQMSLVDAVTGASSRVPPAGEKSFTRLELPVRAMTAAAVEQAIRQIYQPHADPQVILLEMDFVKGESTAPSTTPLPDVDTSRPPRGQ